MRVHESGDAVENVLFLATPSSMTDQVVGLRWCGEAESLNCTDHHVLERGTLTAARNSNRQNSKHWVPYGR